MEVWLRRIYLPRHILTYKCRNLLRPFFGNLRSIIDPPNQGRPPITDNIEGIDGHRLMLAMAMLASPASMMLPAYTHTLLGSLLDLRCIGISLSTVW